MPKPSPYNVLSRDLAYTRHPSPLGDLLLAGDSDALHLIAFPTGPKQVAPADAWMKDTTLFADARAQLDAYFAGDLTEFDLTYTLDGTEFQNSVWQTLATIPFGETWSYGQLAKALDRPKASRAVGAANGANPLPIILPCHRVIGASGDLTGFGGGMKAKELLLTLEGVLSPPAQGKLF